MSAVGLIDISKIFQLEVGTINLVSCCLSCHAAPQSDIVRGFHRYVKSSVKDIYKTETVLCWLFTEPIIFFMNI